VVAYSYCLKIQRNLLVLEKLIMQMPVTHADPSFLWLYSFAAVCFCLGKDNQLVQSGLQGFNTSSFAGCEVCWLKCKILTGCMESCAKLSFPEWVQACNLLGDSMLCLSKFSSF